MTRLTAPGPAVLARDLSVQVRGAQVLPVVSFSLERGRSLAVVGPSGSGKTTLLGCVAGTAQPSAGSLIVDGTDLVGLSAARRAAFRRQHIGLVFQDPELLDELTVEENVALSLIFSGVRRPSAQRRARAALAEVGLERLASARTGRLSGGEAQRVAVARALVKDSVLVVADEPTASRPAHRSKPCPGSSAAAGDARRGRGCPLRRVPAAAGPAAAFGMIGLVVGLAVRLA